MRRGDEKPEATAEVMTIEELAVYLKVAKSTLYKLSQEGRIPAQKVGRHWRYRKDTIDHWLSDPVARKAAHPEGPRP